MKKTLAAVALAAACLAGPAFAESGVAPAADQVRPLLIGATVPELTLTDAEGAAFDLAAALSKKPAVVVFYRGGW